MLVHFGGRICDLTGVRQAIAERNIRVIEDAAHAFGSVSPSGPAGSLADAGCLSFDPIKNITCGEGGALATNDDEIARKSRLRRNVGVSRDTWSRLTAPQPWYYEVHEQGLRNTMGDLNASIGLVQLRQLEAFRSRRLEIVRQYGEAFRDLPGIVTIRHDIDGVFPFNYVIRILNHRRDALANHLRERGIGTTVNYIPCHLQPLFSGNPVHLPVSEKLYEEILTLPLYTEMTGGDVEEVAGAVSQFIQGNP